MRIFPNATQLTSFKRSQKYVGISFVKTDAAVANIWLLKVLIICPFEGNYQYKTNKNFETKDIMILNKV